jgi:hypothetical protein
MFSILPAVSGDVNGTPCIIWIFEGCFRVHNLCLYKKCVHMRYAYKMWMNRKLSLECLDLEGRITVDWILRKQSVTLWAVFIWFIVGFSTSSNFGFHKRRFLKYLNVCYALNTESTSCSYFRYCYYPHYQHIYVCKVITFLVIWSPGTIRNFSIDTSM